MTNYTTKCKSSLDITKEDQQITAMLTARYNNLDEDETKFYTFVQCFELYDFIHLDSETQEYKISEMSKISNVIELVLRMKFEDEDFTKRTMKDTLMYNSFLTWRDEIYPRYVSLLAV